MLANTDGLFMLGLLKFQNFNLASELLCFYLLFFWPKKRDNVLFKKLFYGSP